MRPRPPWTTRPPTGQACGRPFGFAGSPPLPGPDAPAVDNHLRLPTACLPLQFFFNFLTGKTDQDTGLRKHQGRDAEFCLSGRGADTWAGLHLAREKRACAPAPAGAMPWCWRCRCWWHWPPSRVAALALVTAFPALGLINIASIYWHDYCWLQYLCHACMIAFAYVVSLEADLALSVLVVSGGGLIVRCTSSRESCSV